MNQYGIQGLLYISKKDDLNFFFLEYAGELRIIALRRKKIGPLQNTATSLRTGP
jgi:hypothetical protein